MAPKKAVIAFDLYGTLLSTESIAQELAGVVGPENAQPVAALWRRYQLEYTWRINSMGLYRPFSDITRGALKHAVAEFRLSLASEEEDALMEAYNSLHAFPEVPQALEAVGERPERVQAYIFSNGTHDMIDASVRTSPDLGPRSGAFREFISVDEVQAFKPDRRVYEHLARRVRRETSDGQLWLVTSNPFDVVGAKAAGIEAAWVDRPGNGWSDRLGHVIGDIAPTFIARGVDEAVEEIITRVEGHSPVSAG